MKIPREELKNYIGKKIKRSDNTQPVTLTAVGTECILYLEDSRGTKEDWDFIDFSRHGEPELCWEIYKEVPDV